LGDHEVQHGNLDADFRGIVRSGHLRRDEESKVLVVQNRRLVEVDEVLGTSLLNVLGDDRLQHGVKRFMRVHKNDWVSKLESSLHPAANKLHFHGRLNDLQL